MERFRDFSVRSLNTKETRMLDAEGADNACLLLSNLSEFGGEELLDALFRLIDDALNLIF